MTGIAQKFSIAEHVNRLYLFLNRFSNRCHSCKKDKSCKKYESCKFLTLVIMMVGSALITGCQSGVSQQPYARQSSMGYKGLVDKPYSTEQAEEIALIRTQMAAHYIQQNQLDSAKRQLEKALAANKRYAPAYDMMAVLLQTEGSHLNIIKAEDYFRRALALDPQLIKAHNNYGVYLSQLGRHDEAIKQFEIAGSALGYEGRINALENLGLTALKADDYQLATETFVRILERDRTNLVAHIELVDLLINSNQMRQAENLYNEMLELVGDQADHMPRLVTQGIKLKQNKSL